MNRKAATTAALLFFPLGGCADEDSSLAQNDAAHSDIMPLVAKMDDGVSWQGNPAVFTAREGHRPELEFSITSPSGENLVAHVKWDDGQPWGKTWVLEDSISTRNPSVFFTGNLDSSSEWRSSGTITVKTSSMPGTIEGGFELTMVSAEDPNTDRYFSGTFSGPWELECISGDQETIDTQLSTPFCAAFGETLSGT